MFFLFYIKTREKGFEPLSKILEILILPIKLFPINYLINIKNENNKN